MKIDIISGFLGAGKTTLIKKLLDSKLRNENVAIIENEFGEISIDGKILRKYGINIKEINCGCICCSLTKDFKESLKDIKKLFNVERILIEPSGVAKLSDIIKSVKDVEEAELNCIFTVIDALNFDNYIQNFDEFYVNQIKNAETVIINDRGKNDTELLNHVAEKVKSLNKSCKIITAPLDSIDADDLIHYHKNNQSTQKKMLRPSLNVKEIHVHEQKHKHNDKFNSLAIETNKSFDMDKLKETFFVKINGGEFGNILRAKGLIESKDGKWVEFHYTPGMFNVYSGTKQPKGQIVIIGDILDKNELKLLFS